MFKILYKILKRLVIGMLLLFGYNTFLSSFNMFIPINMITIIISSLFDIPGIIGIAFFFLMNY